jgi:hypothetical protein
MAAAPILVVEICPRAPEDGGNKSMAVADTRPLVTPVQGHLDCGYAPFFGPELINLINASEKSISRWTP